MTDTSNIFTEDIGLDDDADTSTDQPDASQEERTDDSQEPNEKTADETVDETSDDDEEFDVDRAKEKIRRVNSEARNLRKEKKALERKVAELEGETGDELETLREENNRLRREVSLAARKDIAVKYGLPESFADRLKGDDEDDWKEDAKALAADLKPARKPGRTNNPGASRSESPAKVDPADAFFAGI